MIDKLASLAIGTRYSAADLYDEWTYRAGVREYSAGQPREEAERDAVRDVEEFVRAKR